jgi:hypothetical protein
MSPATGETTPSYPGDANDSEDQNTYREKKVLLSLANRIAGPTETNEALTVYRQPQEITFPYCP